MVEVTLRFKVDETDKPFVQSLVTAWLEDEGVNIRTAGQARDVDLTYVRERDI